MQYEFEDFRKKPPTPSWINWHVPSDLIGTYLFKIIIWCIAIPYLFFGGMLAPLPLLIQIVILDYFIYLQFKNEGSI